MKKIIIVLCCFAFACQNEEKIAEQLDTNDQFIEDAKEVEQYKGLIPCADCMGIEVILTLKSNHTYTELNTYLTDKVENPHFEEVGTYEWKKDTLYLKRKEGISKKLKTDTALMSIDLEGKLMNDEFGMKYNLKKVF